MVDESKVCFQLRNSSYIVPLVDIRLSLRVDDICFCQVLQYAVVQVPTLSSIGITMVFMNSHIYGESPILGL